MAELIGKDVPALGGTKKKPKKSQSALPAVFFESVDEVDLDLSKTKRDEDIMGPMYIRREKMRSVPVHLSSSFFAIPEDEPSGSKLTKTHSSSGARRKKQVSRMQNIIAKKLVRLDMVDPEVLDFFETPVEEKEKAEGEEIPEDETMEGAITEENEEEEKADKDLHKEHKLFKPLVFAPPVHHGQGNKGGHGHGGGHEQPPPVDEKTKLFVHDLNENTTHLKAQIEDLRNKISGREDPELASLLQTTDDIIGTQQTIQAKNETFQKNFLRQRLSSKKENGEKIGEGFEDEIEDRIIRAKKKDYIKTGILALIMVFFVGVCIGWKTHGEEELMIHGVVGLACETPCEGDVKYQDFFFGHNSFHHNNIIDVRAWIDPTPTKDTYMQVDIATTSGEVEATVYIGPVDHHERRFYSERVYVRTFKHPEDPHVMNAYSTTETVLTFTLYGAVLAPLAEYSVIIAACIMILIYLFILLEVVHRTLVAIFGSFIALAFYFAMTGGITEPIEVIMLHMEWATLGLLFGMMLIVGELSHTGIFEWCSVRLLVASKGSFNRLMVLLCLLTAVASAFLDNVTTMLLIAPVTIDMCNILNVDPRPYLISEVILSNVGGTATLIGDPPNIIIGSVFEEIGFTDFIIHILPCIFLFCIPASLVLLLWIYRYYFSYSKMKELDAPKLKRSYPIYDQPRLLIAGTTSFFVILLFFLHPLHHKETAMIALIGAFLTMSFTNPHDVQDALRNHIEWDTLLFFAGLFVLVEVCAAMGLLQAIGDALAQLIAAQAPENQLAIAITLIMWVSAITSAWLDNIPFTATMIPVIQILSEQLPDTLPITVLAWALSFGACLGGNGTLLGASANIVTAGISTSKGYNISFLNFLYPGKVVMLVTVAIANIYMLVRYVWLA